MVYFNQDKERAQSAEERSEKMRRGAWYIFEDGHEEWCYGMSAQERRVLERRHGRIVRIIPE